jgi:cysteine synthase A
MVAAVKGYKLILVMPDSMSIERRRLMLAYGASFDLTPREKGMKGAIARAEELKAATPGAWIPQQFENPGQRRRACAHHGAGNPGRLSRRLDALITGVGTGGHLTGTARVLKALAEAQGVCRRARRIARHQRRSARAAPHPGHWRGLHPQEPRHQPARWRDPGGCRARARDGAPLRTRRRHAGGHFLRRHAGRHRAKLPDLPAGATVLGFNYDTGERYLSVEGFLPAP